MGNIEHDFNAKVRDYAAKYVVIDILTFTFAKQDAVFGG